ncbi:MAG TPA: hypothetical protein DEB56_04875 [Thiobacillus sp.]|nr:hypothetical protein [Thiobacillus sp.]
MDTRMACPQFCPPRLTGRRQHTLLASMTLFLLPMWLMAFPAYGAGESEDLEHSVKAAFLYKFASYVEWPANAFPKADAPIAIAVTGSDVIAAELGRLVAGRTAQGRPIVVKRLAPGDPLAGVHILFVGPGDAERLAQWARDAQAHSTLLVTDSRRALERGSTINFVLVDRRVRFEISLDAAEKSSLKLSSRLLAVAQRVHPGAR